MNYSVFFLLLLLLLLLFLPVKQDSAVFEDHLFLFNFNCTCMGYCTCLCVCIPCAYSAFVDQKGYWTPGTDVTKGQLRAAYRCWESSPGPLEENLSHLSSPLKASYHFFPFLLSKFVGISTHLKNNNVYQMCMTFFVKVTVKVHTESQSLRFL